MLKLAHGALGEVRFDRGEPAQSAIVARRKRDVFLRVEVETGGYVSSKYGGYTRCEM